MSTTLECEAVPAVERDDGGEVRVAAVAEADGASLPVTVRWGEPAQKHIVSAEPIQYINTSRVLELPHRRIV